MQRKDFEALASAIRAAHSGEKRTADYKAATRVVNNLLPHLRSTNAAFDDTRFIKACGLEVAVSKPAHDPRYALCA